MKIEIDQHSVRLKGEAINRHLVKEFAASPHPRSEIEKEGAEFKVRRAARKRRTIRPKLYLINRTLIVSCELPGRSLKIATVYGVEKARAIATRLAGVTKMFDGAMGIGEGVAIDPSVDRARRDDGIPA